VSATAEPLAFLAVNPGTGLEKVVPIFDSLFVGRECIGIDDDHRLLIDDPEVSRSHLEIRLDPDREGATAVDLSTNGTRLNGTRIEKAQPVAIRSGDRLMIGGAELEFRSARFRDSGRLDARRTVRRVDLAKMAMVVGDIITYSTVSQYTANDVLVANLERLFGPMRTLLAQHRGALSDYAGDALLAVWELEHIPEAPALAVDFAIAADRLVREVAPDLELRDPDGRPLRMGWAVVFGDAAVSSLTGAPVGVVGDATNLAFRLSGLAGRDDRPPILVTKPMHDQVADRYKFGEPFEVETKGRTGTEVVYGITPD
jgi:adenylate cyclase